MKLTFVFLLWVLLCISCTKKPQILGELTNGFSSVGIADCTIVVVEKNKAGSVRNVFSTKTNQFGNFAFPYNSKIETEVQPPQVADYFWIQGYSQYIPIKSETEKLKLKLFPAKNRLIQFIFDQPEQNFFHSSAVTVRHSILGIRSTESRTKDKGSFNIEKYLACGLNTIEFFGIKSENGESFSYSFNLNVEQSSKKFDTIQLNVPI